MEFSSLHVITISKSKLRESKKQLLLESVTAPSASELASANSEKKEKIVKAQQDRKMHVFIWPQVNWVKTTQRRLALIQFKLCNFTSIIGTKNNYDQWVIA